MQLLQEKRERLLAGGLQSADMMLKIHTHTHKVRLPSPAIEQDGRTASQDNYQPGERHHPGAPARLGGSCAALICNSAERITRRSARGPQVSRLARPAGQGRPEGRSFAFNSSLEAKLARATAGGPPADFRQFCVSARPLARAGCSRAPEPKEFWLESNCFGVELFDRFGSSVQPGRLRTCRCATRFARSQQMKQQM